MCALPLTAIEGQPTSVVAPLDPAEYGIDPLTYL